jgi:hypothetical protein
MNGASEKKYKGRLSCSNATHVTFKEMNCVGVDLFVNIQVCKKQKQKNKTKKNNSDR